MSEHENDLTAEDVTNRTQHRIEKTVDEAAKAARTEINRAEDRTRSAALNAADETRERIAVQLRSTAQKIRKETEESEIDATARQQVERILDNLDNAADYVERRSVEQMRDDATETMRQRPWSTAIFFLIVGFIIGKLLD